MAKKGKKKTEKCPICGKRYYRLASHMVVHDKKENHSTKKKGKKGKGASNSKPKDKKDDKKEQGQTGKKIDLQSDVANMTKPQEYLEFITFMAVPRVKREEVLGLKANTQEAFAEKYKLGKNTLTNWKNKVGFWDDVVMIRKEYFKARTADVILALETKNLNTDKVNGNDVRVLLTYTGEYSERQELEHKVHPELAQALEKIGKVLD